MTDLESGPIERPAYRPLHLLNVALLLAVWVFTIAAYGALPERIPAHVGMSGVTRWASRDSGIWLLLPILGTLHGFLMYALSGLADGAPAGLNVPQKKRLLSLPRDGQRYAMEPTRPFMFFMAAWLLSLTLLVQWRLFTAARAGPGADLGGSGLSLLILAYALLPLPGTWWLSRAIRRRIDAWEARDA